MNTLSAEAQELLNLIPENGSIGNVSLSARFGADRNYWVVRQELLDAQMITLGRGRGGSVRRFDLPTVETNASV
jgi:hypothetical protein